MAKKDAKAAPAKTAGAKTNGTEGKEMAPHKEAPLAAAGPIKPRRGFENVSREDILLPRLQLLQAMSPEVTGDLAEKAGSIYDKLSGKNYGDKTLITVILHFRSRILWGDREKDEGILCSSPDGITPTSQTYAPTCAVCPKKDWDNEKEGKEAAPDCTQYDNFLVLVGDEETPIVLPMERTKAKAAKKLISMGYLSGGDFWEKQYSIEVVRETKKQGKQDLNYFTYNVAAGPKTSPERRVQAEQFWTSMHKKSIRTEQEREDAPAGAAAGASKSDF